MPKPDLTYDHEFKMGTIAFGEDEYPVSGLDLLHLYQRIRTELRKTEYFNMIKQMDKVID